MLYILFAYHNGIFIETAQGCTNAWEKFNQSPFNHAHDHDI